MKNYLTPFVSYLASLMIVFLLFWGCGTKELEFESPYQEVEELFDEVGDLPDVEDPDPEITEPAYQEMSTPPLVSNLLEEILAYGEEDKSISENSRQELDRLKQGLEALGVNLDDPGNFESTYLTGVLELEAPMDEELEGLMADFMGKYGLDAPLPVIPEVTGSPGLESLRIMDKGKGKGKNDPKIPDIYGPCFQHARETYDDRIYDLDDQLNDAIDRINANYLRRAEEAEERLMRRNKQVHDLYMKERKLLHDLAAKIIKAAVKAGLDGKVKLGEELRAYALIYAYHMRTQIKEWSLSCLAFNQKFFEKEIKVIERLREERIEQVLNFHEESVALALRLLNKAFDRCHNQGKGN